MSIKRLVEGLPKFDSHSSILLPSALDVYLESLIDDHSFLLLRKLGQFDRDSDTAQVAVTETPKTEIPRFPDDVKYSTELYLWHQRFGHLASKM